MKEKTKTKKMIRGCTCLKYLFPVVLACLSFRTTKNSGYIWFTAADVLIILTLNDLLMIRLPGRICYFLNSITLLVVNVELGVLYFSGSAVTLTMLQNINSAQDLSGHAFSYIGGAALVVLFSFLPVKEILHKRERKLEILSAALAAELVLSILLGSNYSAASSVYGLWEQQRAMRQLSAGRASNTKAREKTEKITEAAKMTEAAKGIEAEKATAKPEITEKQEKNKDSEEKQTVNAQTAKKAGNQSEKNKKADPTSTPKPTATPRPTATPIPTATPTPEVIKDEAFYKREVADAYELPESLSDQPNVILIFTEGLSQNIIDDERNVMPNLRSLQAESINFVNYYNHTFATYRALQGQLFSGYQLEDSDRNHLTSIQSILKDNGYHTVFINTEPKNDTFTEYLESMGFDEVVSDSFEDIEKGSTQSDESSYKLLLETAETLNETEEPYFLAIYTIGTHASYDSAEHPFGDGSSNVLNRFYNADYQFGEFFKEFQAGSLSKDTVLIFTADHSTYAEADFREAFPNYVRSCSDVDEIPLSIYYQGVEAQIIDAAGRNSLDLAPTVLDFLDISGSNYFLGESLFTTKTSEASYDTVFFDPTFWKTTDGGVIADLDSARKTEMIEAVQRYFSAMAIE